MVSPLFMAVFFFFGLRDSQVHPWGPTVPALCSCLTHWTAIEFFHGPLYRNRFDFPSEKTHSNLKISSFLWDFPWRTVNVISRWSTVDASWIHDIRNMPCAPRHWWCHLEHLTLSTTTESFACRGLQGLRRGEQNGERSNKTWTCQWFFSGDKYMF